MNFKDFEPDTFKPNGGSQALAQSDVFDLRKVCLEAGETLSFDATQPRILSVVVGALKETTDGAELQRGDNALLPAAQQFVYKALQDAEVLITENFIQ